ncbi:MAG: DNA recombination protein RmuC, partial [Pyrinomonadaceae bacterium]
EYAIKNPVSGSEHSTLWLPIDSKFPQEDYLRVQEAAESGDPAQVQAAENALLKTIRNAAKEISSKYICPPHTTDYAIMFLATEGLHAEVLRQPSLVDELLQNHRIFVAGPTTLAAILCSFRAGYQTLAIERRASEVWTILGAIKTEFSKFGDVLAKVKTHLNRASNQIDQTGVRSRAMERHLRSVEEMPEIEAAQILTLPSPGFGDPEWNGHPETDEAEESVEEPPALFANQDNDPF